MNFFSIEWLADDKISVEHDDGTVFQGDAGEILTDVLNATRLARMVDMGVTPLNVASEAP